MPTACCILGLCSIESDEAACRALGGFPLGERTDCSGAPCNSVTVGCCLPDNSCVDLDPTTCQLFNGTPHIDTCDITDCGEGLGACCLDDGATCQDGLTEAACIGFGGFFQGEDTTCAGINCLVLGACCEPFSQCNDRDVLDCQAAMGDFQGPGTTCAAVTCPDVGCRGPVDDFWPLGEKLHSRDRCEMVIMAGAQRPVEHRSPTTPAPAGSWEPATVMPKRNSTVPAGQDECRIQYGIRGLAPWGWVYPYLCSEVRVGSDTQIHWHRGVFALFDSDQVQAPIKKGWVAMVAAAENDEDYEVLLRSKARICSGPEQ